MYTCIICGEKTCIDISLDLCDLCMDADMWARQGYDSALKKRRIIGLQNLKLQHEGDIEALAQIDKEIKALEGTQS